jgi:cyanophycinase
MAQRRRDSGDPAKPLYASEPVEHHPSTVHPIALPAGPAQPDQPSQPNQPSQSGPTSPNRGPTGAANTGAANTGRQALPAGPHTAAAHPRVTYPPAGHTPIVHPTSYQTSAHAAAARPAAGNAGQRAQGPLINMAEQLAARPAQLRGPVSRAARSPDTGPLLIIGGAEQMSPPSDTILAAFVDLAGGSAGHIAVIATASNDPDCREIEYQRVFSRLGAGRVTPLRITDRDQASSPEAAAAILTASGVFFTGGDQLRITTVLGGSKVDSVLHSRVAEGMALAGTSAGAAMMSGTMIIGGQDASVSTQCVRIAPGLEFLPGVLIDMHFAARGRLNRLLSAVAMYPHELGLGIDEDTAILVTGDRFEVLGAGSVTVIDAGPAARITTPPQDGPIAVHGMQLHVLPAGHQFHLTGRRPLLPGTDPEGT